MENIASQVEFWMGVVAGGIAVAVPLAAYIIKLTPTKVDDSVLEGILGALKSIESFVKRDLDGDGKIGK